MLLAGFGISITMEFRIKGFTFVLVWLLSGVAYADLKLEAEFQPKLKASRVFAFLNEGAKADFRYVVHNNGSVSDISVTHSDHPKLTELVKKDVALWRYKPWPLKDNPETVEIAYAVVVTIDPNFKRTIRIKVLSMRCRELNREVTQFRKSNPGKPLHEMDAFADLGWASQPKPAARIAAIDRPLIGLDAALAGKVTEIAVGAGITEAESGKEKRRDLPVEATDHAAATVVGTTGIDVAAKRAEQAIAAKPGIVGGSCGFRRETGEHGRRRTDRKSVV